MFIWEEFFDIVLYSLVEEKNNPVYCIKTISFLFSDEANNACSAVTVEEWRRPRSESTGAENDSVYVSSSIYPDHSHRRRRQVNVVK